MIQFPELLIERSQLITILQTQIWSILPKQKLQRQHNLRIKWVSHDEIDHVGVPEPGAAKDAIIHCSKHNQNSKMKYWYMGMWIASARVKTRG